MAETRQSSDRLAGETRIDTAVAIAQRAFPDGADVAYLANADNPVDAIVGGTLTDGPILLVPGCNDLPVQVAEEVRRLDATTVIALGGEAAVCEAVLDEAQVALQPTPPPSASDVINIRVSIELLALDGQTPADAPYTVSVTRPDRFVEGGEARHDVIFTSSDGDLLLDDPRFVGITQNRFGEGQLVTSGRGCGAQYDPERDEVVIPCTTDLRYVELTEDESASRLVRIQTDDAAVGPTPVLTGRYVLDQVVRWARPSTQGEPEFSEGDIVRITYEVEAVDQPRDGYLDRCAGGSWGIDGLLDQGGAYAPDAETVLREQLEPYRDTYGGEIVISADGTRATLVLRGKEVVQANATGRGGGWAVDSVAGCDPPVPPLDG
ncbi:cell wall-binding repeat-containing protein [Euzebya tangerina]|uniref:cell wall-binding repeat-containing protein n=1 Tax=Euzebya tangerina TaxID=591198 RepID=UPI0013C2C6BC|nr:cell wall-binding repeat-containing protein [Euzebya tangerina]